MDALKESVNRFILDPKNAEFLSLVKSLRNGAVYGTKIRFPHALVMVFLFRSGSIRDKCITVFKATRTHARNLATFAFLYRLFMLLLRHTPQPGSAAGKEASVDSLLAGVTAGYAVFGRGSQSSVNQQIVTYVAARVVLGLAKMAMTSEHLLSPEANAQVRKRAWPVFAAVSWGMVMWLFRWHPDVLQPSLRSSMNYLYVNATKWDSFRNFLIHNQ